MLELLRRVEAGLPEGRELSVLLVTPFTGQRNLFRERLRGRTFRSGFHLSCSTVHCCQGGEADVVVFDLVDPGNWFLNNPDAGHLWCVACSRAREQLFVVGSSWDVRRGRWSGPMLRDVQARGLGPLPGPSPEALKPAA